MVVRPAVLSDIPDILPMVAAICALHESWDPARYAARGDVVEMYARWLPERAQDPRSVFLVGHERTDRAGVTDADAGPRPGLLGFLIASVERAIPIYRVAEFGFVHDLWVEPAARGRGLGEMLARAAIDRFRRIGVAQVRLETSLANDGARRLFERAGFRVATIDMLLELTPETR
ncbi:MAG: GNAT family N-acetyltransferase [Phycisphaerales bacterium]|nr:GNAT family N-acetyltransferase [Phycisphaeraceae bacterium]